MKSTFKKYQIYILVAIVTVAVVIGIYWYGKRSAEKDNSVKLPGDTDWGADLTEEESELVSNCANALYQDLKGFNGISARNHDPYEKMTLMSDKLLVAVANQFNMLAVNDDETIVSWLDADTFYGSLGTTVQNLIKRLLNLGVK